MDLKPAITKLFEVFQTIDSAQPVRPGFAMQFVRYQTASKKMALFMSVLSPPTRRFKGKEKNYFKILKKSEENEKPISPNQFEEILAYYNTIYPSIIKPRDEILEQILLLLSGLRLNFIPMHNVKYIFDDYNNPKIEIYNDTIASQFIFYINIIGLVDDGLYLSYEKQMRYIKNEAKKGINPNFVQKLPPLRTGDTQIEYAKQKSTSETEEDNSDALKEFRDKIQQKKVEHEINEELAFETVINFSQNSGNSSNSSNSHNSMKDEDIRYTPFGTPILTDFVSKKDKEEKKGQDKKEQKEQKDLETYDMQPPIQSEGDIGILNAKPRNLPKPPPMPIANIKNIENDLHEQKSDASLTKSTINKGEINKTEKIALEQPDSELISLKQQLQYLKDHNNTLEMQLQEITDNLTQQLHQKDTLIKDLKEKVEKDADSLLNDKIKAEKELKQKLESYERIIKSLEKERQSLKEKVANFSEDKKTPVKEIKHLEKNYLSIQNENRLLANALKRADKQYSLIQTENNELKAKNNALISEKLNLEMIITDMQEEIQLVKRELALIPSEDSEKQKLNETPKEEHSKIRTENNPQEKDKSDLPQNKNTQSNSLSSSINQINKQMEDIISHRKNELEEQENNETTNNNQE